MNNIKLNIYLLVIIISSSMFFSACSGNSTGTESSSAPGASSISPLQSANGGRALKIAVNTEIDSFDPYLSAASDTQAIMMNIFEGLTMCDPQGNIIPALAKSWDISENGLEYVFQLEEGVLFHDRKTFSADDVVFSLQRLSGLDGGKAASSKFEHLEAVEKLGDYSVKVILRTADASFLSKCMTPIVPQGYTEQATKPVGTGPYMVKDFVPGQLTRLIKNESYYNQNRLGKITAVEFVLMPDDNAKVMALRSGSIDMFQAAGEIISQLDDNYKKYSSYGNMVQLLALNNEVAPFDNADVRRALNYAVNRQEVIDMVTNGSGYAIYTSFTPAMPAWYNKTTENIYSYNIDKAKELLKTAGYENGFDMEITVPSNYQAHINTAQVIVSQLEKIGVKAHIKQIEWGQWLSEVYTDANYQSSIVGLSGKIEPHEIIIRFESNYGRNFYKFKNPEYDAIVAKGILENDTTARKSLYDRAQEIITTEAAAVFIQDIGNDLACQPDVCGYTPYPITYWDLPALYYE